CGPALSYLGHSNVMKVVLEGSGFSESQLKSLERNFYTTSSCGVCGKSSIDALKTQNKFTTYLNRQSGPTVSKKVLIALPDTLRKAQAVFESTGGLHASGLFSAEGELLSLREDVGRHNALDKVIGDAFLRRQLPLENVVLMLSGRISFELVQKASMAGIRFIAAVGAPSSLAVELAKETDMTLVGFLRGDNFNVYSGDWRLK
ncbi:MAG: sulfurtransferase FdhD, partial [Proteobacteria bacterium]